MGPIFYILCQRQHQTPTSHTAARLWCTFYHNPLMPNVLFYLFLWTGPCSIEGVSDWFLSLSFVYKNSCTITKTCLYNFDPLEPHFYIEKLGFTGVCIILLIFAQNIDCGYSLEPPPRGGSNEYPQSMFLAEFEKYHNFLS